VGGDVSREDAGEDINCTFSFPALETRTWSVAFFDRGDSLGGVGGLEPIFSNVCEVGPVVKGSSTSRTIVREDQKDCAAVNQSCSMEKK